MPRLRRHLTLIRGKRLSGARKPRPPLGRALHHVRRRRHERRVRGHVQPRRVLRRKHKYRFERVNRPKRPRSSRLGHQQRVPAARVPERVTPVQPQRRHHRRAIVRQRAPAQPPVIHRPRPTVSAEIQRVTRVPSRAELGDERLEDAPVKPIRVRQEHRVRVIARARPRRARGKVFPHVYRHAIGGDDARRHLRSTAGRGAQWARTRAGKPNRLKFEPRGDSSRQTHARVGVIARGGESTR